jgi:hypothetical protein
MSHSYDVSFQCPLTFILELWSTLRNAKRTTRPTLVPVPPVARSSPSVHLRRQQQRTSRMAARPKPYHCKPSPRGESIRAAEQQRR